MGGEPPPTPALARGVAPRTEAARWALPLLAAIAVAAALWAGAPFLVPLFTAAVLAVLVWPAVQVVERGVRSRVLASLLVVGAVAVATAGLAASVLIQLSRTSEQMPAALAQLAKDVARLPASHASAMQRTRAALAELDRSVARATGTPRAAVAGAAATPSSSIVSSVVDWATELVVSAGKAFAGVLLQAGVIVLLAFFMLCEGEALTQRLKGACARWLARVAPRPAHEDTLVAGSDARIDARIDTRSARAHAALAEGARQVRLFAGVTTVINLVFGVAVAVGFAAAGIPGAVLWGVAAAALHFVPYAGLALMVVLGVFQAYVVHASPLAALLVGSWVMVAGVIVGTAMTVSLQGRAARIGSAVLFAGTVVWSVLWGAWGLVLGPLLVVIGGLLWREAQGLGHGAGDGGETEPALGAAPAAIAPIAAPERLPEVRATDTVAGLLRRDPGPAADVVPARPATAPAPASIDDVIER
jgi:predicted PurR-regulated permease PerM